MALSAAPLTLAISSQAHLAQWRRLSRNTSRSRTNDNLTNNYNFTGSYPIVSTAETIRIDQSFGANDKVFGSYNVRDNVRNNNIGGLLQLPLSSFLTFQDLPTHLVRIGYDHVFSPRLLNHALIGFTRVLNKEAFITATQGKDWPSALGLPDGSGPLFPGIGISEGSTVNFGNIEPLSNQGYNSKISDNPTTWATASMDERPTQSCHRR